MKIQIVDIGNNLGYIHRGKIVGGISRKIIHLVDTNIQLIVKKAPERQFESLFFGCYFVEIVWCTYEK